MFFNDVFFYLIRRFITIVFNETLDKFNCFKLNIDPVVYKLFKAIYEFLEIYRKLIPLK